MELQEICESAIRQTGAIRNCLVHDLESNLTLASARNPDTAFEEADVQAAVHTGRVLFRGRYVDRFVQALATALIPTRGFVHEVQITSEQGHQFMAAIPGRDDAVLVIFTEKTLTLGLGWMAVHRIQDLLAESAGAARPVRREAEETGRARGAPQRSQAAGPVPPPPPGNEPAGRAPGGPKPPPDVTADPKPVPPPGEPTATKPLPNPLVRRKRNANPGGSGKPPAGTAQAPAAGRPDSPASAPKKPWSLKRGSKLP